MTRGRKRKSDEVALAHCIICDQECDENKSNISEEVWENLKIHAQNWCGLDKFGTLYENVSWENGPSGVYFHKTCRTDVSNKRKLEQALRRKDKHEDAYEVEVSDTGAAKPSDQPARRLSRTDSGPLHDKDLCVWCMKPEDVKHPGRDKWHIIQTMDAWHAFKAHTVHLEDIAMRDRILALMDSNPDPFASEFRYHRSCWKKYILPMYNHTKDDYQLHLQQVRLSEVREMFFQHVRMVIFEQHEPRTLQGLLSDYKNLLKNFGFDTSGKKSSTIKDMLHNEFHSQIGFHERFRKNESTLVYDTSAGGTYIEAAIYSWGVSDEQLLNTVARRLKDKLSGVSGINWPPHVDQLDIPEEPNDILWKFFTWLKNPSVTDFNESCQDPTIFALTSLLLSYITGKRTPFQVKLSVMLHGLTRSREIVDILKKFSLGISYKDVLHLYDSWAKEDIEKNEVCPEELAEGMPGTAILDNDDFKDDTLTGGNTSHRTNVMFVQPEDVVMEASEPCQRLVMAQSQDMKRLCMDQHRIEPYKTVKRVSPQIQSPIDITPQDTKQQKKRAAIHALVRLNDDGSSIPSELQQTGAFAGFQASVQHTVVKSKPYYFLTFPKPPYKSVVNEVMKRMVAAAERKCMPFILLVGDQPVYALIVQLKSENPEAFNIIVPFLGPFHIHGSFIYAISKRFGGSGLSDILVAAGVIAEGSVDQALRGKHYKRSIRCLRLMYETLVQRLIKKGLQDGMLLSEHSQNQLAKLRNPCSQTSEELQDIYTEVESDPELLQFVTGIFESVDKSSSSMAKYWLSFMQMTEILMMNIHALRTQNWEEFKSSLRLMLPWLQIYDNDKYGRWLVQFWLEISNLPEEKAKFMKEGLFSQSMTGKPYSCLPLDLWIEMTMNKGSKMKAGWLKILKNEKMLLTDTRNVNHVNRVRASLHVMANLKSFSQSHSENSPSRKKIDEQAVQDLDGCITEFNCDPFDLDNPTLRSLQAGALASDELVADFESAHEDGEKLVKDFFNDRMFSENKSFDAIVHRNSRHTFIRPPTNKGEKSNKATKTDAMENKAMASIITLAQTNDKFTLSQVMEYRVTDECLAIFNINGTMKKVQKSKLMDKLHMQPIDMDGDMYTALVDMGFIWRLATPTAEDREKPDGTVFTWGDYANKIFSVVLSRHPHANKIVFVNDPYDLDFTIKDSERERRMINPSYTEGSRNIYMKTSDKLPASKDFHNLFCNSGNKHRLQQFLMNEFSSQAKKHPNIEFVYSLQRNCWNLSTGERNVNFQCKHSEADTIMFYIYSRIRKAGIMDVVVIDAEDTDVVVLASYVAHHTDGLLAIKRKKEFINCQTLCSEAIAKIVIPLYIHSGSDTTSAFFGHGKKTVYDKGTSTEEARTLLAGVGKVLPVTTQICHDMAHFTIRYIYNDKVSKTLTDARALKWSQMKRKSTQRIPPDQDSHDLKVARVNYIVHVLLNYAKPDAPPSPLIHGWTMNDGKCEPVRYTRAALPKTLNDIIAQQQTTLPVDNDEHSDSEGISDSSDDDDND